MHFYDPLLYPFALIYQAATGFRNKLFDIGSKKATSFSVPVVVVGNLSMGGTGKTPMVEYLVRVFQDSMRLGVISRGYRRKSSGFVLADQSTQVEAIGDESFQIYQKYGQKVAVAVGEARALAIPMLLAERPEVNLILLDDAFQHRYVAGDCSILLTTYQKPFFNDRILPLGTLREHASGARRADIIVVTKCPELNASQKDAYRRQIWQLTQRETPVLFARIKYGEPFPVLKTTRPIQNSVILVTGIASNEAMIAWVAATYHIVDVFAFPDHHRYTVADVRKVAASYTKNLGLDPVVLTTEKDAVKLNGEIFLPYWSEIPIFALPIEMNLPKEEEAIIEKMVWRVIKEKQYTSEE